MFSFYAKSTSKTAIRYEYTFLGCTTARTLYFDKAPADAVREFWNRQRKNMGFLAYELATGQMTPYDATSKSYEPRTTRRRHAVPSWVRPYDGAYMWPALDEDDDE